MMVSGEPAKVLLCSYAFHPSIGGIETVSLLLAEQWTRRGIEVVVVTNSADDADPNHEYGYPVYRRPDRKKLLELFRWSDLVYQNNIALNYLWPLLLVPRPLVITNQTPIDATIEKSAVKRWLKVQAMRLATCTSCSQYLADTFPVASKVVYNPLRDKIFYLDERVERTLDLAFVGRLSDSKGVDTLLLALKVMKEKGATPGLMIIGGGGEERKLKALCTELGLDAQVTWTGPKQGPEIARLLNQHQVLVVPSRRKPAEALGIVAMEGIACGCVPVVSEQGGLPEAVGPCGVTFECENSAALAGALERVLGDAALRAELRRPAEEFLRRFDEDLIVDQYLEIFAGALPREKMRLGELISKL